MSVNVKPLADRVLIEPVQAEQKTASGIIIPDTAKEKPQKGTVVAVGPGKTDEPVTSAWAERGGQNDLFLFDPGSGEAGFGPHPDGR